MIYRTLSDEKPILRKRRKKEKKISIITPEKLQKIREFDTGGCWDENINTYKE
jgi:hypothetical protein